MILRKTMLGFTLIELIITMVLISIISVIMGQILIQGYQTFLIAQNITETDWQGFLALNRLASDIHTIRSAAAITTVQATQFAFTDINNNNVQYQLSGSSLLRNSEPLASSVQSLTFSYFDKNGATTATAASVRYISISITLLSRNFATSFTTLLGTRGMS